MTIKNFSTVINGIDGEPLKEGDKSVTASTIATNALLAMHQDEMHLPGEEKAMRFALSMKVYPGGEIDLKPEEIALIKQCVGKSYTPLLVGRMYEFLDA